MVGGTALHNAAKRGDLALCKLLIEAGADRTLRNHMGMTPLEYARWELAGDAHRARISDALEALLQ